MYVHELVMTARQDGLPCAAVPERQAGEPLA